MEERLGQRARSAPNAEPVLDAEPVLHAGRVLDAAPAGPRPHDGSTLLDRQFGRDEIAVVRHQVSDRLVAAGLTDERLHGFVLAVNEVITNAVLHGGGHGRAVLRLAGGWAWCTVTDAGPGLPAEYLAIPAVPAASKIGGRGVWLAHQLCDEVTVATGPIGTTIGLGIALPRTQPLPHPASRAGDNGLNVP